MNIIELVHKYINISKENDKLKNSLDRKYE